MNPHPTDNDNCLLWERNFDKSYGEAEELIHSLKDEAKKQECDSPYSVDSVMKEASKIIDSQVDRMRNDLKAKESLIQSMREQIFKRFPDPAPQSSPQKVPQETANKRLKQKLQEVLKIDEKLEAEAERSITEINIDLEKHQADLKKLHESQVEEYMVVQEEIKNSFFKDMDKLMERFDEEMSRFRKDNAELLADHQAKHNKDSQGAASTHQP
ncbi:uncharacterized protein Dana_GF16959 [Drosophila ananassae]|uniref:Uncharacterized protein n=1 Tax=Drosophila ananassae TaxID=7217 RepID=B3LVI5_DROAN|nr:uncharacterized protein LOC6499750 [Drosophila ananassae]EDV42555.1 uncharacterized protein Dana_GF16959 [Drosophila ananassae]